MLRQNWFMNKKFDMFEDYADVQGFYDTEEKCFYIVFEEYGQKGSLIIQQITEEHEDYNTNMQNYIAWKSNQK